MGRSIYVMSAGGLVKVGMARHCEDRRAQVEAMEGKPVVLEYVSETVDHASRYERYVHDALAYSRMRGEWFCCSVSEAVDAVKSVLKLEVSRKPYMMLTKVDPELKRKLQRLADADRRSLTNYIEVVLKQHVEKKEDLHRVAA